MGNKKKNPIELRTDFHDSHSLLKQAHVSIVIAKQDQALETVDCATDCTVRFPKKQETWNYLKTLRKYRLLIGSSVVFVKQVCIVAPVVKGY